ncbi:MAG: prepilin-type N-terminal cleavage/methylation domain-containing protein [Sideroxydans sp.]|jgi:MSHA biogenesis protein MshO
MREPNKMQTGFTLVEMIIVIVITGIIGGIVAIFIQAPVQGYVDSARRAELTDIADTAVRRMARDVRTAVPNSVRIAACTPLCVEFLPTRTGGRYRAAGSGAENILDFDVSDTSFDNLGPQITFVAGDQIVIGSTQSDGAPPYQDPTSATGIRRAVVAPFGVPVGVVSIDSTVAFPGFSRLWDASPSSQRFDVVDGTQQAVTYACEGTLGALDANGDGQARLVRHWGYGFNPAQAANVVGGSSARLADKVSACNIEYAVPNQRFGLVGVRLTLTSGGESVTLYNEIHVSNAP